MATVTLTTVWITLASDPSQSVTLTLAQSVRVAPVNPQVDRMYGAGRFRAVNLGAIQQTIAVAASAVSLSDVELLEAWNGLAVWYRDDSGRKFACTYRDLVATRHSYDTNSEVTFTVTETTLSEAV